MKQRVISAAVAILFMAVVLYFMNTVVLNIVIALLAVMAVYEVLKAAGCIRPKAMSALCLVAAAVIPFLDFDKEHIILPIAGFGFAFGMMLILLGKFETLRVEKVGFATFITIMVPITLSIMVYFRNKYQADGTALFYILLVFVGAFITDTGAYLGGRAFGKHKLAPKISPNKTVEGAISGAVLCMVLMPLYCYIYSIISANAGTAVEINYLAVICIAPVVAVMAMMGDLSASVIKRQCGVKDFGSIMPGHGGVMDRFDSVLFVAPTLLIYAHYLPLIAV